MLKKIGFLTFAFALGTCAFACGGDDSDGGGGTTGSGGGGSNAEACVSAPSGAAECEACLDQAAALGQTVDALVTCSCQNCAAELGACFASGDATADAACRSVVECGQTTGCAGTECYCGVGVAVADCMATGGTGVCKEEIATAAGCQDEADDALEAQCVAGVLATAGSVLAKAIAVGSCATGDPGAMPPVVGKCESP